MAEDYSVETCKTIENKIRKTNLHRPIRISRYEPGTGLTYTIDELETGYQADVHLVVEKFIGGGFAGQVYKVRIIDIRSTNNTITRIKNNGIYAMKILIPPSGYSLMFRNLLYWIGFQGPFQLQCNPAAARAGALWQKFIRQGAKLKFGDANTVVDIHALFIDRQLGSCGEISEWVDGRIWRLEVDDRLDWLKQWKKDRHIDETKVGSPEYRAKYKFMHEFVTLLHDMGGHEFARQYEWSTCKSQPNCLKREGHGSDPKKGLTAVDFRAGLALLPFAPMSPGDFKLILQGLGRGSLVQFDRGCLHTLERFINEHQNDFIGMGRMLTDLKKSEDVYRHSIPDITHNHLRLIFSKKLWSTMFSSTVAGWRIRNRIDNKTEQKFNRSKLKIMLFFLVGLFPFIGSLFQKIYARADWRKHYGQMISSWSYLKKSIKARIMEKVIEWHRDERVSEQKAFTLSDSIPRFLIHLPFSILPAGLHKFLTDFNHMKDRLDYYLARPVRLYFKADLREEWLREMVDDGLENHIISKKDADTILSQLSEPFIQKYLKCLAVHVCTLPVTQVVSVIVAIIYNIMHPEMSSTEAIVKAGIIIGAFQITPISPGSIVRGLYVVWLVVHERNFKDYNIAVFLGFFKYIGYLAFPIQMAYRYPVLARFMARHWANESVHIVPVFGEAGALLEHWVYCLFYNWPLTIQRRIKERMERRALLNARYWHLLPVTIIGSLAFGCADYLMLKKITQLPDLMDIWWITPVVPMIVGGLITVFAGGANLVKRMIASVAAGIITGLAYTLITAHFLSQTDHFSISLLFTALAWRVFVFTLFSVIGAILTEVFTPDPKLKNHSQ